MSRKLKNFVIGFFILFPFMTYILSTLCDGFYSSDFYTTNFFGMLFDDGLNFSDFLMNIVHLGDFSRPILEPFIGPDGFLPFLSSAFNPVYWLCDYYILLPVLYLIIRLFTFIPSMLIRFLHKIEREEKD